MELERFKITVLPLRDKLMNVAQKLLGERADAEDVVQDAFLKLWHIRDRLDSYRSVEALAVMVVKNLALDVRKKWRPEEGFLDGQAPDMDAKTPAELLEQQDSVACICRLIEQLPALQQSIIRMKDIEGYEAAEIAAITGTQVEAVRVNLSRARKKIKEQITLLYREML